MFALPLGSPLSASELALRLSHLPGLCWLDADAHHPEARFSFVGAAPVERIEADLSTRAPLAAFARMQPAEDCARSLAHALPAHAPGPQDVPRWVGYVAYDAHFAGRPQRLVRPGDRPVLSFARYDALFAFDHRRERAFVVGDDRGACERLLARARDAAPHAPSARARSLEVPPPEQHLRAIECALEHIARGDIYQVNLARCFRAAFEGAPLALWSALRAASPVPLGFYYDAGARVLLARTMERFLRWDRGTRVLRTRPIKGTIARLGTSCADDAASAERLRGDQKERAEHAMIVDLMRNDLGRVAELGSVCVPEVMTVEAYAGLSHLVSTVECRTRGDVTLEQVIGAAFPPGSVTGTPKLRAIEIIEALEPVPRDVYTGAVGFVDRQGGLSLAVAIRTAILQQGELRYFAGGGIVEASDPARELAETELKARVLFDALAALQGASGGEFTLSSAALLR